MIYFICQEWKSTKGNHAGMVHLFAQLHNLDDTNTKLFVLPERKGSFRYALVWLCLLLKLLIRLNATDVVLFSECLSMRNFDQTRMAYFIKKIKPKVQTIGMVHLIPSLLEALYPTQKYRSILAPLDKILTLGSSLTSYLISFGVEESKVFTSFHYVDSCYYNFERKNTEKKTLECIVIGNLGRDFSQIANIVKGVPKIKFLICKGRKNVDAYFTNNANVELLGYMEEKQLVELMKRADISLNVMEDTIGSNVICTSLAMSLAMVCSDVGSIRDYCDIDNSCFCKTTDDFINALNVLASNIKLVEAMQKHSYELSDRLHVEKFYKNLKQILSK